MAKEYAQSGIDNEKIEPFKQAMVRDFRCKETEKIFNRQFSRKFPADIQRTALRLSQYLGTSEDPSYVHFSPLLYDNC
jgi:hypothetical protein